jgi:hypothetical protein
MSEEYDVNWGSLLSLIITTPSGSMAVPFRNFRYRVSTDAEEVHLPSQWNAGWHDLPPAFTASFDVYQTGKAGSFIHQAQLQRAEVEFVLAKRKGEDWTFVKLAMSKGKITDVAGDGYAARDIPILTITMKFNEFAFEGAT